VIIHGLLIFDHWLIKGIVKFGAIGVTAKESIG
jgi:hypothetical protein